MGDVFNLIGSLWTYQLPTGIQSPSGSSISNAHIFVRNRDIQRRVLCVHGRHRPLAVLLLPLLRTKIEGRKRKAGQVSTILALSHDLLGASPQSSLFLSIRSDSGITIVGPFRPLAMFLLVPLSLRLLSMPSFGSASGRFRFPDEFVSLCQLALEILKPSPMVLLVLHAVRNICNRGRSRIGTFERSSALVSRQRGQTL